MKKILALIMVVLFLSCQRSTVVQVGSHTMIKKGNYYQCKPQCKSKSHSWN